MQNSANMLVLSLCCVQATHTRINIESVDIFGLVVHLGVVGLVALDYELLEELVAHSATCAQQLYTCKAHSEQALCMFECM